MLQILVVIALSAVGVFAALACYGSHLEQHPEKTVMGAELQRHYRAVVERSMASAYDAGVCDGRMRAVAEVFAEQPGLSGAVAAPVPVVPAEPDDEITDVINLDEMRADHDTDGEWWRQAAGV
ncbi:hypothetical protein [Gordonia sp. i37]|uniref:hypothetical protein n=1 Tax=Gordonia sp. i37 TaxID=1961707 RepID=UPI0009D5B34B|nr:hypothetical protein [Gordonia sp. i37]OPX06221.1 hypothetical protein B1964_28785 [Gordonia sp. i37]